MAAGSQADEAKTAPKPDAIDLVGLSQSLLDELRQGGSGASYWEALAALEQRTLALGLQTEAQKLAFWINVYNAANLFWMRQQPPVDTWARGQHFFGRRLIVAGRRLSLNRIEHGILRRGQVWWARGYLRNPFRRGWSRRQQLAGLDPRIHFALNCGANSCPAIRFYSADGILHELELATVAFMATEVQVVKNREGVCLQVSQLFRMYLGDFGGRKGLLAWISRYRPDLPIDGVTLHFLPYDWTINLDRFV